MQCPHLTAQSPYSVRINTGFLNKCYSDLPYSEFSIKKYYCSLAMVHIYLDKFIILADSLSSLFIYSLRRFKFYLFSVPAGSGSVSVPMPAACTAKHSGSPPVCTAYLWLHLPDPRRDVAYSPPPPSSTAVSTA
jgi:hypothetical protein